MRIEEQSLNDAWLELLSRLISKGQPVSPRQMGCRELLGMTLHIPNARHNIVLHPERKLNYRFMVAEWLWIWFGHDDVATIAPYNSKVASFSSDDGVRFAGAYGPRIREAWAYVTEVLRKDQDTRQAVIPIYRQPTGQTKDVPCTLSMQFLARRGQLNTVVAMRSSDVWLGLPYDVFTFTQLANILAAQLHLSLGSFTIHLGSSHLYDRDRDAARKVLIRAVEYNPHVTSPALSCAPPTWMDDVLRDRQLHAPCIVRLPGANVISREAQPCGGLVNIVDPTTHMISCSNCGARYTMHDDASQTWLGYARALMATKSADALAYLKDLR